MFFFLKKMRSWDSDIFARKLIQRFKTALSGDALNMLFLFITCNGYLLLLFFESGWQDRLVFRLLRFGHDQLFELVSLLLKFSTKL